MEYQMDFIDMMKVMKADEEAEIPHPKFSIIIPAHNSGDFNWRAFESISKQTFTDYELIVVCDSCEDDTKEVAEVYTKNVIVIDAHNDGIARNAGIDAAKGDWILFMDDDDWWLHDYVLEILDPVCKGDSFDILCFGFIWKGIGPIAPVKENNGLWPNVWSKVWRRKFIENIRFKNVPMESDLHFTRDVIAEGARINILDTHLYYYNYMRKGSQTELAARREDEEREEIHD